MARVAIFGMGPMRWEESSLLFALPLRTWHFAGALARAGHAVLLVSVRRSAYDEWPPDRITRVKRDGVQVYSLSDHLCHERPEILSKMLEDFGPTCLVGSNTYPASIAVNFARDLPFWADVFGDPMAEAQAKAAVLGNDAEAIRGFRRILMPILVRGDRFSTCSERQRSALVGQLGLLGRLTAPTDGYEFVDALPAILDDAEIESLGAIERAPRPAGSPFVLLWSGGYNTWADVDTLFLALETAMHTDPAIRFVSLGGAIRAHDEKTFERFRTQVQASDFADRCTFPGWVPTSELAGQYAGADAAVLADRWSYEAVLGTRTRMLDWLAAGLPIATTRVSEITEELGRRGLAATAACGDAEGLAKAILSLSRDREKARQMGLRGRRFLRESWRADVVLKPLLEWASAPTRAPDLERFVPVPQDPEPVQVLQRNVATFTEIARTRGVKDALRAVGEFAARKIRVRASKALEDYAPAKPALPVLPGGTDPPEIETPRRSPAIWRERIAAWRKPPRVALAVLVPDKIAPIVVSWTLDQIRRQYYPHWRAVVVVAPNASEEIRARAAADVEWLQRENLGATLFAADPVESDLCRHEWIAGSDFVGVVGAGDLLRWDALAELVEAARGAEADVVYADESEVDETAIPRRPLYKPAWSPDLLLSMPYLGQLSLHRTKGVLDSGGLRFAGIPRAVEYDLALRSTERAKRIEHVPQTLCRRWTPLAGRVEDRVQEEQERAHAQEKVLIEAVWRRKIRAVVERGARPGTFRVRRRIEGRPKVSILVPTRDRLDLLVPCLESIEERTTWRDREIVIIDNGSRRKDTLRWLDRSGYEVLRYDEPFNFSRLNNKAARRAKGEYLMFLNNDTEVVQPQWIEAMLEHAQRREVGAVGAKLIFRDGTLQHSGIVYTKDRFGPAHQKMRDSGQDAFGDVVRNYSAVTAACMMMRRDLFLEVGGFDPAFAVAFNDVDLCLRLREAGYLVVYTPYAVLFHHEGSTRGLGQQPSADGALLQSRWLSKLEPDPYLGFLGLPQDAPRVAARR